MISFGQDTIELVRILAGPDVCTHEKAVSCLDRAARLDVDVFAVMAAEFRLETSELYKRTAELFGLRYRDDIRPFVKPFERVARLDALAQVRSCRGVIGGHDVLFLSPDFDSLVSLASDGRLHDFVREICLVAPATLRLGLAEVNREYLLAEAVQRLPRQFPLGAAHLALTPTLRWGFVLGLLGLVLLTLMTPFALQPYLLAAVTVILAAPSVFRLWAARTAKENIPLDTPVLLDDADLPVYSVLIPLRNEAHMVPQVAAAMRRLDYPALCIKRTN